MPDALHKCRDCDRMIPEHVPCCIYCKPKYRARGICWYCGEAPVKPKQPGKPQSQYCVGCQQLSKSLLPKEANVRNLNWRGTESRGRRHYNSQQAAHMDDTQE